MMYEDQIMKSEYEECLNLLPFFCGKKSLEARFVYEKKLGHGAYGCIMCGYRSSDHCSVAIKVIPSKVITDWYFSEKLQRPVPLEILMLALTSHIDGVVGLIEYCVDEVLGEWYIVMERCTRAVDLFSFLCSSGDFLDEATAARIFRQLVRIVVECHRSGVLHCDIKEENILIDPAASSQKIWLIDFGSGTLMTDKPLQTCNGTPAYWPPEWLKHCEYRGCQLESWCMGIVLYSLLCGGVPFEDARQIMSVPRSLHFPRRDLSPECIELIRRCLEPDPECRIKPGEMIQHLWLKNMADQDKSGCDSGHGSFDEAFVSSIGDQQRRASSSSCGCTCIKPEIGHEHPSDAASKQQRPSDVAAAAIELLNFDNQCLHEIEPEWNFRVISRSLSPDSKRLRSQYLMEGTKSVDQLELMLPTLNRDNQKVRLFRSCTIESEDEEKEAAAAQQSETKTFPIYLAKTGEEEDQDDFIQFDLDVDEDKTIFC